MTRWARLLTATAAWLLGLALLCGCSGERAPSILGTTVPMQPSTIHPSDFAAIRTVLGARARAVLDGNEKAFLASVDRAEPAFYRSQQVMYANLRDLPVTAMSYEVGDAGLPPAPGVGGGPVLRPEVVEHVFFSGTDRRPVANEVDETFVKLSGHWRLAADRTDTTDQQNSARPWAGPRISVVTRGPLIVITDRGASHSAAQLADTVVTDLKFDADVLQVPVDDHVMVDATSSGSVSRFDNHESAAAVTFNVFAGRNFEHTAVAGLRIKVNPHYISYLDADPSLLRHELTHYLMFRFSGLNPKWLSEGLAEYVSHQPGGFAELPMDSTTYSRLMARPHDLTVSGLFGQDPSTDYPLAMACVTYLVDHGGMSRLKQLMRTYAAFDDAPYEDAHTAEALRAVYQMSPKQVADGAFAILAKLH